MLLTYIQIQNLESIMRLSSNLSVLSFWMIAANRADQIKKTHAIETIQCSKTMLWVQDLSSKKKKKMKYRALVTLQVERENDRSNNRELREWEGPALH